MRLQSLELTAFGPYAGTQRIDVARLAGSGLFLLEGPTGAGKSTILDAITFALYGGLAGDDAGEDRLRSHFAPPDAVPSVTLEFALRGVGYRITRIPEHRRPKKRGDGFTTEHAQVHLERRDAAGWASLSANKAEVGDLIADLVGLSRAQFTQVMLLPQNEFAKFLRAGDDDRRVLLTRLFGTQLYDRITAVLDQQRATAVRDRQQAEARIQAAVAAAAEAAGLDAAARGEILALPRAERATRLKEVSVELALSAEVSHEGLEVATEKATAALATCEQARQRASLMTRLIQALAELRAHESTRPGHDGRAGRLAAARRAEPVRPLLAGLAEAQDAAAAAHRVLLGLVPDPDETMLAGAGGPQAFVRAEAADHDAAALQHLVDDESSLAGLRATFAGRQQDAAVAASQVSSLEAAKRELPEQIAALDEALARSRLLAAGLATAREQQAAAAKRSAAAAQYAGLVPLLEQKEAALRAATDVHQHAVDAHQQAVQARLDGMAAVLAAQLAPGAACPVCGSAEHPAPARAAAGAVTEQDLAAAQDQRDRAEARRGQLADERDRLAREVAGCAAVADGGTPAVLAAGEVALAERAAAAERAAGDAARLEREVAGCRAELQRVDGQLLDATDKAAAAREMATKTGADLAALEEELAAAAQGHASVAVRQAALRRAAAEDRELGRALDDLAAALAAAAKNRDRATAEALGSGFATLELARAAVLTPAEQTALDEQVTSWDTRLAGLRSAAQAGELAGLDPDQAGQAQAAARAAADTLAQAQAGEQEVRAAHEAASGRVRRLGGRLDEVAAAEDAADRLEEETATVIRLAGLAKGMDGHRRMALTTYVLRQWFGQVVAAANVRLCAMSAGRYELRRTDEGGSKRERTGLTLAVIDRHTGEERSPRSLSGGETFYTSLALALGLADVVKAEAGGVDLDTLFIDEGFGSLDTDTLDQVMAVIDELRDRGRVVGIVSHVADLKDRVAERLEVRRLPDGSSTVRVVA